VKRLAHAATGFAYVEILVAVLLLAVCALPAANAVRNALSAADGVPARAYQLRCMRDLMETVLAEPYPNLLAAMQAAKAGASKPTYSDPDTGSGNGCIKRKVVIDVYEQNGISETAKTTPLLRIDVMPADTGDWPGYSFTTLVGP
jgi:Tfp pilus assembly protein PilV